MLNNKSNLKHLIIITNVIIVFFIMIVSYLDTNGPDYHAYKNYFDVTPTDLFDINVIGRFDCFFFILISLFKKYISIDFSFFNSLYITICYISIVFLLYFLYRNNFPLFPLLFYFIYPFLFDTIQLRNFGAQVLFLIAIILLVKRHNRLAYLFAFLSINFHSAYIVWFLLIPFLNKLSLKKTMFVFIIEMFVLYVLKGNTSILAPFLPESISCRLIHYDTTHTVRLGGILFALTHLPLCLFTLLSIDNLELIKEKLPYYVKDLINIAKISTIGMIIILPLANLSGHFSRLVRMPLIIMYLFFFKLFFYKYKRFGKYKFIIQFIILYLLIIDDFIFDYYRIFNNYLRLGLLEFLEVF